MSKPALNLEIQYSDRVIRMVGTKEQPEWVAADVCDVLDIANHRNAVADFADDEKGVALIYTLGGSQQMVTVTESGLYRLITRSRKPEAERFQRWVFHDVLPSIRKHGCYPPPDALTWAGNDRAIVQVDHRAVAAVVVEALKPSFDELRRGNQRIEQKLDNLHERLPVIRKEIPTWVTGMHCRVLLDKYGGMCPACEIVRIVNSQAQPIKGLYCDDHWTSRGKVTAEDTWGVCEGCNLDMGDPGSTHRIDNYLSAFKSYQKRRRLVCPDKDSFKKKYEQMKDQRLFDFE